MTTVSCLAMGSALIRPQGANTAMGALVVEGGTPRRTAIREEPEPQAQQPQYTHGFLWNAHDLSDHGGFSSTACWGLTISPVPGIPLREFENHEALRTIKASSGLFQVNCSLNIDQFQDLLVGHPNQALIDSVYQSLCEGYWLYADTKFGDARASYSTTLDMSSKGSTSDEHLDLIQAQVKVEVVAGRYSMPFRPELLLGMYSLSAHAVPKSPDTFCLINHQSYGDHSLNLTILKEATSGTCMDRIRSLRTVLLHFQQEFRYE